MMAVGFKTTPEDKAVGFVTAVKIDNNTMAFGRYVVAIGGTTADNVKSNFALLTVSAEVYNQFVKSQVVASSGAGGSALLAHPPAAPANRQAVELTAAQVATMASDEWAAKATELLK